MILLRQRRSLLPSLLAASSVLAADAAAQTLRTTLVASGLSEPTNVVAPPGDEHRLFVTEQHSGLIRIVKGGVVLPSAFLNAGPVAGGGEQGLLGLAFHPAWATNGKLYVYVSVGTANIVREITVANPAADVAAVTSVVQVLSVTNPFSNHNGGCLQFGPDGYLYVAKGDGGSGNDPQNNGQNINSLLGKLLRIDVNGDDFPADATRNYAIPPSNPFAGATPGADEIWFYGLRNPWRFSFDRQIGDLLIGDVGQNAVEEIDFGPGGVGGLNYGWRCMEGNNCTGLTGCTCFSAALQAPIQTYTHAQGCSVTGGFVYRGSALPALQGTYFYADYCSNTIWSLVYVPGIGVSNFTNRTAQLDPPGAATISNITSFGEDARGEILIVEQGGEIWRIEGPAPGVGTCAGDGSLATPCPCANNGALGRGCGNSAVAAGAFLSATGSVDPDTLYFTCSGLPGGTSCIFLKSDGFDGAGAPYGDGVLCLTGFFRRLRVVSAVGGVATYPALGDEPVSSRSWVTPGSGESAWYQVYYRNSAVFCTPDTFNVSNGYAITW
jgi:glucose/arabinose dehydrogenase